MSATVSARLRVNGADCELKVEPRLLLVDALRDHLGLTGTHVGCDTSQCGACTVHMDGQAVKSCTVLTVQADGSEVTTIEGLAKDGELHPLQEAFWNDHALQCGYCTPGMIMAAAALLEENPNPSDRTSATRSRATFAAARATTTSSGPCWTRPGTTARPCKPRSRRWRLEHGQRAIRPPRHAAPRRRARDREVLYERYVKWIGMPLKPAQVFEAIQRARRGVPS